MLVVIRDSEVHLAGESCERFPDSGQIVLDRLDLTDVSELSADVCPNCFPELAE